MFWFISFTIKQVHDFLFRSIEDIKSLGGPCQAHDRVGTIDEDLSYKELVLVLQGLNQFERNGLWSFKNLTTNKFIIDLK